MKTYASVVEFKEEAVKLFGSLEETQFQCPTCNRIQSVEILKAQMAAGIESKRFGKLEKGMQMNLETSCYSPTCNYTANGLFTTGILVILEKTAPYDASRKENCSYVLPLASQGEKPK